MVKFYGPMRRKIFDDDADWLPPRNRKFVLKNPVLTSTVADSLALTSDASKSQEEAVKPKIETNTIKNDAEGLSRAYDQGDVFGQDDKMFIAGSHTARDWFDDVTKIPQWQYVPAGINPVIDIMNTPWGRYLLGTGDLRQSERYQKAKEYLLSHPQAKIVEGHSLGGAVALQLEKDFPGRVAKTVTYGAPVWDPFGRQKKEVGQENVVRFSNTGDIVSIFDNSALKTSHPNPFDYVPSLWHDFHNEEQAGGRLGGEVIRGATSSFDGQKSMWQPWNFTTPVSTDPSP